MGEYNLLYKLHEIDKKKAVVTKQLADTKEAKGLKELNAKKEKLDKDIKALSDMINAKEKDIKMCELESESYYQEKKKIENEIYSGEITDGSQLEKLREKAIKYENKEDELAQRFYDLTEELSDNKDELAKKEEDLIVIERQIKDNKKQLDQQIEQQEEIISDLERKKEELIVQIDKNTLNEYNAILKKYPDSAIVMAEHEMCAGCNIALPTSIFNELQVKGLIKCSSCGRFLVDLD